MLGLKATTTWQYTLFACCLLSICKFKFCVVIDLLHFVSNHAWFRSNLMEKSVTSTLWEPVSKIRAFRWNWVPRLRPPACLPPGEFSCCKQPFPCLFRWSFTIKPEGATHLLVWSPVQQRIEREIWKATERQGKKSSAESSLVWEVEDDGRTEPGSS